MKKTICNDYSICSCESKDGYAILQEVQLCCKLLFVMISLKS